MNFVFQYSLCMFLIQSKKSCLTRGIIRNDFQFILILSVWKEDEKELRIKTFS
jgi:hypothetical protein